MRKVVCFLAVLCLAFASCSDSDKTNKTEDVYLFVHDTIMRSIYYWVDNVNNVPVSAYMHPNDMMVDMRYEKLDRWSQVYEKSVIDDLMSGVSSSYGFVFMPDIYNSLRVAMVYKSSDAYKAGLRRGHLIESINGESYPQTTDFSFFSSPSLGEEMDLVFKDEQGASHAAHITASVTNADPLLNYDIYRAGNSRVGYVAYESFADYTRDSLFAVMDYFSEQSVDELVVDLRYNGGGDMNLLIEWLNYLIPQSYDGDALLHYKHNKYIASEYDSVVYVDAKPNTLDLDQVFVITSQYTASASEGFINCLKPYMNVHQIGTATHGKPVGMYVIPYDDWFVLPISFETVNADGEGGFFGGIEPECRVFDDLSKNWGSEEACIKEALNYIETGSYSGDYPIYALKSERDCPIMFKNTGMYSKRFLKD